LELTWFSGQKIRILQIGLIIRSLLGRNRIVFGSKLRIICQKSEFKKWIKNKEFTWPEPSYFLCLILRYFQKLHYFHVFFSSAMRTKINSPIYGIGLRKIRFCTPLTLIINLFYFGQHPLDPADIFIVFYF
jgi:hypothetical protein